VEGGYCGRPHPRRARRRQRQQRRWVFGAPTFFLGERVLVFVREDSAGHLRSLYLGMGKFRVVRSHSGREYAVQNLVDGTAVDIRRRRVQPMHARSYALDALFDRLDAAARRHPRTYRRLSGQPVTGTAKHPRFAFSGPPAVRWFAPDRGEALTFRIDASGDTSIGPHNSTRAAREALQAWSTVACTNVRLTADDTPAEPAPFARCDGKSQILFNDPFDDIADPVNCVGVLGVGGVCGAGGDPLWFSGSSFFEISEGDVIVANGFGNSPFWNIPGLAEVLTHEIGHTLGLAHSSEDPEERNPLRADATMYFRAHFDYRGAALRDDDRAAICALYPGAGGTIASIDRAAFVFDPGPPPERNRMLLRGTFRVADAARQLATDSFFLTVHDGARFLIDAAVPPDAWLRNVGGNRFRWRARTIAVVVALDMVQVDPQTYEFTLVAKGETIASNATGSFTVTLTLGEASTTVPLTFRSGKRALLFP
jgi:hypothetical protein